MASVNVTLPADAYRTTAAFEREISDVFACSWMCLGTSSAVEQPGSYLATAVASQNVLVVRDHEGELRAFHNVCRHRGALLCEPGEGRLKRAIRCPYHAWAYALDGRLVGTPHVSPDELDRASLGLLGLPVEEWQGMLFVDLGGRAGPLSRWLQEHGGGVTDIDQWDLSDLVVARTTVREIAANWKVVVENYLECLHCPTVHPELSAAVPTWGTAVTYDASREDGGVAMVKALTKDGTSRLPPLRALTPAEAETAYTAYAYPNLTVNLFGSFGAIGRIMPVSADRTEVVVEYVFDADTASAPGFDPGPEVEFIEMVAHQDAEVCELIQRGITSRAFQGGVLPQKEEGIVDFLARYRTFVPEVPGASGTEPEEHPQRLPGGGAPGDRAQQERDVLVRSRG